MRRWARMTAVLAAATAVVAASGEVAAARPPVPVKARTVHPVTAPDVMQPGLVHLRNVGSQPLLLLRKKHAGLSTLLRDVDPNSASSGVPALFRHFEAVVSLNPHADAYVRLRRGTYYLFSEASERIHAADIHVITVQGATDDAGAPHARPVTVHLHTANLTAPHVAHAGRFYHLRNRTHRLQELLLFRVSAKTSAATLRDLVQAPSLEKLFRVVDPSGLAFFEPVLVAPGEDVFLRYPGRAGRYVLADFPTSFGSKDLHRGQVAVITLV